MSLKSLEVINISQILIPNLDFPLTSKLTYSISYKTYMPYKHLILNMLKVKFMKVLLPYFPHVCKWKLYSYTYLSPL